MEELITAGILGTGHYAPEKILTNAELEQMVDTSDEWIRTRTGIETRHIAADNENTSDMAVKAAKKAMEMAGTKAEDIDYIFVATTSPDYTMPATACLVQQKLGCTHAGASDIYTACSGFIYSTVLATQMVRTGLYKRVLVIGAETLSRIINWSDRNTCILFGDGAGAAVIGPVEKGLGYLASDLGADGAMGSALNLPASGVAEPVTHRAIDTGRIYVHMEGSEIFKAAVRHMDATTLASMEKAGITKDDIDLFIPHQANYRIIHSAAHKLGLPPEKVAVNVNHYGNTSSASIAIALDEAVRSGRLTKGQVVVMTAFGGGLTWGSMIFRWAL